MATAAPNQNLPLFYNAIEPLNSTQHAKMKVRGLLSMAQVGRTHAIPVTVDEFTLIQRHYCKIQERAGDMKDIFDLPKQEQGGLPQHCQSSRFFCVARG